MLAVMTTPELLSFPCAYPIKVMMRAGAEPRAHVDAVFGRHAGAAVTAAATERSSAQGNFRAVTYTIQARDAQHIAELFADIKDIPGVLMVL
jgi:putative lipoic acid-binding regulatory protein